MNKLRNIIYLIGLSIAITLTGCSDPDDEITSIDYDRLFSPTDVKANIVNRTNIRLSWDKSGKDLDRDSYTIEVFDNGDLNFDGTPVVTLTGITENPYTITGLEGETSYSIRIQAVGSKPSSKWSTVIAKTDTEQIMSEVAEEDITATSVIIRWTAGEVATDITLTPGDIVHTVTADEIATGAATITGLASETEYTAVLKNGTKTRGSRTFTTLIDLGGATAINEGDDLVAILDAANDGDAFVILSGEFELGEYTLTKALSLAGYKATDKPVINGYFKISGTVGSLTLRNLIISGADMTSGVPSRSFFISGDAGSVTGDINITSCEISDYKAGVIYDNSSAQFGNVKISDCIITNIEGSGGDGFDFRGGKLTSLTVENTTFNTGFRAFLRVQISSNIVFNNCTFYKISTLDNSNNTGIFRCSGGGTLEVKNCLFVETGVNNPTNIMSGNWCRNAANMAATPSYSNNIYSSCHNLWVGLYTNPADCSAKEVDPQFKDTANGDFTVQNIDVTVGDPRWLP